MSNSPEIALAAAVIERCVHDLKSESHWVREKAHADFATGGLDYWIEALSVQYDVADALREKLAALVRLAA